MYSIKSASSAGGSAIAGILLSLVPEVHQDWNLFGGNSGGSTGDTANRQGLVGGHRGGRVGGCRVGNGLKATAI